MAKSMRTVAELAKAVAVLQTRDARRLRDLNAMDARVRALEEPVGKWPGAEVHVLGDLGPGIAGGGGGGGGKHGGFVYVGAVGDRCVTPTAGFGGPVPPRPVSPWQRLRDWWRS